MGTLIPCKWSANFSNDSTSLHYKTQIYWHQTRQSYSILSYFTTKKLLIVRIICRIINNLMSDWLGKVFSTLCVFFPYISWCPPTSTSFLHLRLIWWNSLTSIQLFKLCTELSFQAMHGTIYSSYHSIYSLYQATVVWVFFACTNFPGINIQGKKFSRSRVIAKIKRTKILLQRRARDVMELEKFLE